MRPIHLVIAGLAPVLANCSTHPLVDDVARPSTSDIVNHVRCEAQRALADYERRYGNASANTVSAVAYEFTFDIAENNNAKGDISWGIQFPNGGNFSLAANADSERQRHSKRNFRIVDTFDELRKARCDPETLEKNLIYPIAGEIGIYEVVTTYANLQRSVGLDPLGPHQQPPFDKTLGEPKNQVFRFADTLTFTTTFSGGVNPSFTLTSVPNSFRVTNVNSGAGPKLTSATEGQVLDAVPPAPQLADTGLSAQRRDKHEVVIAIAAVPKKTDQQRSGTTMPPPLNPQSITSTTSFQMVATAKERALFELDRQRMLALQQQSPNLLVGP